MSISNIYLSITGQIGQTPKLLQQQGKTPVTQFSIATNKYWKDEDGNTQQKTQWHNITAFGKTAELVGAHIGIGFTVQIEGDLRYGNYQKDGVTHYTTDIIAKRVQWQAPSTKQNKSDAVAVDDSKANHPAAAEEVADDN